MVRLGRFAYPAYAHQHPAEIRRNLSREPRVALSFIADPDDQYRFLEIRGTVDEIEEDPGAEFSPLAAAPLRHGLPDPRTPTCA